MITISLCMIVKNEDAVLARCLSSLSDCVDEIIIIDTGSEDKTKEVAYQYTDYVYDFTWADDFALARNYSFSKATMEYCMWLDADDVIQAADREQFRELKASLDPSVQVVMMKYHTAFDEQGIPTFSYYRERLIKNKSEMLWKGFIHEVIEPIGRVEYSECAVTHKGDGASDPNRNLRIFQKMLDKGIAFEPRMQFYYARELYYHQKYEEAIQMFLTFIEDGKGWVENNIDACCHCSYCYDALGDSASAISALFRTMTYDKPRAEVCCDIGRHFFTHENYELSVYWYNMALTCKRNDSRGGFISPDCYGYIPCIQLCVCYWKLGNNEKAKLFNELAAQFKPEDASVLHNRTFLATIAS